MKSLMDVSSLLISPLLYLKHVEWQSSLVWGTWRAKNKEFEGFFFSNFSPSYFNDPGVFTPPCTGTRGRAMNPAHCVNLGPWGSQIVPDRPLSEAAAAPGGESDKLAALEEVKAVSPCVLTRRLEQPRWEPRRRAPSISTSTWWRKLDVSDESLFFEIQDSIRHFLQGQVYLWR